MKRDDVERIALIGPTGSGKTTVGARVAALLGWAFVDTDALIVAETGMSIAALFAEEGEARFREREYAALLRCAQARRTVVATGGGIVEREETLGLLRACAWVVALDATPETAFARLRVEAEARGGTVGAARPLLAGAEPVERMRELRARRAARYGLAEVTIATDGMAADDVAAAIVAEVVGRGALPGEGAAEVRQTITTGSGETYQAVVAWGGLATLGARLHGLGLPPRLHVVADAAVARLFAGPLLAGLRATGYAPELLTIPSGEASKSREQLDVIYDWLAGRRAERGEAVVALGGGVIGDLVGYAAATYLRGTPLIQAPTSLLAQVDASIGGKVAINHARGKNLIGAFYAPRLVLADPSLLLTLPARQRTEGWAEAIKHGIALDAGYAEALEGLAVAALAAQPAALSAAVAGSVRIKGGIVSGDEREREGGRRHLLNYGHTIAHALEVVAGYGVWLHGEAVAVGMAVEARIGLRRGVTPAEVVARQDALLARFGLPQRFDSMGAQGRVTAQALLRAALWDKKARGGKVRWVLPTHLGEAALFDDIEDGEVIAVARELGADDATSAAESVTGGDEHAERA